MIESKRTRIKYFKKLVKELPKNLENRDVLYTRYMEYIEKIKKEKQWDD